MDIILRSNNVKEIEVDSEQFVLHIITNDGDNVIITNKILSKVYIAIKESGHVND
jgi:hypothetical protein